MPLTDEEANQEMRKMVAFIMQEAAEKAREIQLKADEEFNIEKAKLVRQETAAIEAQYERRLKQAQVRRKIGQSAQINKTRLQVLQAREGVLETILERTRERIGAVTGDGVVYRDLLVRLLLQAFLRLMSGGGGGKDHQNQKEVLQVHCRPQDLQVVGDALQEAKKEYQRITGLTVEAAAAAANPADSLGGVIVAGLKGRVRVVNTLDARLADASTKLMPTIRTVVFGAPESRRFFD